jgi:light-regulated signal transduction histidine kinase (bacteriophytochrome)
VREADRRIDVQIQPGLAAEGDPRLLRRLFECLVGNAWRFTREQAAARVEVGRRQEGGVTAYYVRDNGVGFDMAYASRLFQPFSRLHPADGHDGLGIGLVMARRIVARHGGTIRGEGAPGAGATFTFTLDPASAAP